MDLSSLTPDKQVKLQYWLDVIRQCRASGLTNQIWCEQHDISLKSYYYWLSKIRKLLKARFIRFLITFTSSILRKEGYTCRSTKKYQNMIRKI